MEKVDVFRWGAAFEGGIKLPIALTLIYNYRYIYRKG